MHTPLHHDVCIVGAGLSGLSVAAFLATLHPAIDLQVLEQADRPGGAIASHAEQGYQAEWGAHGFLDTCVESRELIDLAGLGSEVTTAPLDRFVRYVCLGGHLRCIPQTPLNILRAPLIPWRAKLRVLAEAWQRPLAGEPSVAQWVEHRFGAALLPFADAVFTGTYAGDIERLRIDAVMPAMRLLERTHGSVLRGLIATMRNKKKGGETKKKTMPAMISFRRGMAMLPERLAARLTARSALRYGWDVTAIAQHPKGWRIVSKQQTCTCSHLVLALPVNRCLPLLATALPATPPPSTHIPEARILSVLLGFDHRARIPFGFGYLAPEQEQRFALGALFSSHMFPGRAPEGGHLLEALVGGRRHPERLERSDEVLIEQVYQDLSQLMDLPKPLYTRVLRPSSAIPQLEAGATELLNWRNELHRNHPSLHLCGFGWQGIGINDMVKEARRMAERVMATSTNKEGVEIKGIYF